MKPVKGNSNLARTPQGAIVNMDRRAFRKAKRAKEIREGNNKKINKIEKRLDRLESLLLRILGEDE